MSGGASAVAGAGAGASVSALGGLYVGHAGWAYAHWRKGVFFPLGLKQDQEFAYYASKLPSTEVNNTFYNLPAESTWLQWRAQTPPSFRFAIKLSQYVTHNSQLVPEVVESSMPLFVERCKLLQGKLGPILVQLPPSLPRNLDKVRAVRRVVPADVPVAFEFRHPSWFCDEVYALLRECNFGLVLVSSRSEPLLDVLTSRDFVYVRMHGVREHHETFYTDDELREWADRIHAWRATGRAVYCYFQADKEGYGVKNAMTLTKMCRTLAGEPTTSEKVNKLSSFFTPKAAATAAAAPAAAGDGAAEASPSTGIAVAAAAAAAAATSSASAASAASQAAAAPASPSVKRAAEAESSQAKRSAVSSASTEAAAAPAKCAGLMQFFKPV